MGNICKDGSDLDMDLNKMYNKNNYILFFNIKNYSGEENNMLKSPQVNITTNISFVPFWQIESKEVHVFATTESAEKERPPTYNYVFSKYTLEKPVIIISE